MSLSEFDSRFQREVLALMYNDPAFRKMCAEILEPASFDEKIDATYASIFFDFHKKYPGEPLSRTVIVEEIKRLKAVKRIKETDLHNYLKVFAEAIYNPPASSGYVRDTIIEFGKSKAIEAELIHCADLVKKRKGEKIANRFVDIEQKFDKKRKTIEGISAFASSEKILAALKDPEVALKRAGIPTGIYEFDELLYRKGVGRKEMLVVCGSPGRGKSVFLVNLSIAAVYKGFNVLFYTLEVEEDIVLNRLYSCVTGVPFVQLSRDVDLVGKRIETYKKKPLGDLILKDLPTRGLTPDMIRTDLLDYAEEGKKIDSVVVDYADIMSSDRKIDERRLEHGDIYEQLRAIAKEFNVAMVTASQANRSSLRRAEVDIDSMAEDFSKAMTADYVIGLSQIDSEKSVRSKDGRGYGQMRLFIAKNRNGAKGKSISVINDFKTMRFSIKDWDEFDLAVYGGPTYRLSA